MGCFHEIADGALEGKLGKAENGFKEASLMAARKVPKMNLVTALMKVRD